MSAIYRFEETVGDDGKITIQLPPDAPRHVTITVENAEINGHADSTADDDEPYFNPDMEWTAEEQVFLDEIADVASRGGLGLTLGDILESDAIGMWADREDMKDSVAWVEEMRRKNYERRIKRRD